MAPSHDEDLDWLYRRDKPKREPEPDHTHVLDEGPVPPSETPVERPTAGTSGSPQQGTRRPGGAPPQQPPTGWASGSGRPGRPRRRRRPGRVIGLLLAVVLVWLIAVPLMAWGRVDRIAYEPDGDRPPKQPGTTYLMVGSDSREGLSEEEREEYGTGDAAGQRTDTIMILYLPPSGEPAMISLPRDSYVEIPGNGSNKINAAYSFGGPKLLTRTVEHNTGLRIDKYVEVGFGGFVQMVDAVGGVDVCLDEPMKDKAAHIDLPAGCQELEGTDALGYVRMRKSDPRGDLGRVERQRQMLSKIADRAASPASFLNPVRYWSMTHAGSNAVDVGDNTGAIAVGRMAFGMRAVSGKGGLTLTVPIADSDYSTSAGSAVLWDSEQASKMWADIARGDTRKLKQYAE